MVVVKCCYRGYVGGAHRRIELNGVHICGKNITVMKALTPYRGRGLPRGMRGRGLPRGKRGGLTKREQREGLIKREQGEGLTKREQGSIIVDISNVDQEYSCTVQRRDTPICDHHLREGHGRGKGRGYSILSANIL